MQGTIETAGVTARVITPDDGGHYFFGYYDMQPFDSTGRYHLCHKAPFEDRIPDENDICELGMIDLSDGRFIHLAETNAWNFQQGAMLQWYEDDRHILFNIRQDGAYRSCILNIETGEKRILPLAVANVSQDGKWAVCINFSRIFNFRPGYGYAGIRDPYYDVKAPADDGVYLMDMHTGEYRLIASYEHIKATFPCEPYSNGKLLVNHINFNPSGSRFAMLFRNFSEKGMRWKSQLLTGDLHGGLYRLADFSFQSHYNWKSDSELLIFGGYNEENRDDGLYLFTDLTDRAVKLPEPNPDKDIHCLYSPNRRYILGDGYSDEEGYRNLHFIDTQQNTDTIIGRYYSITRTPETTEYRCDLHARFDRSGRYVSFDSNHIGKRCIALLDMQELPGYEW